MRPRDLLKTADTLALLAASQDLFDDMTVIDLVCGLLTAARRLEAAREGRSATVAEPLRQRREAA